MKDLQLNIVFLQPTGMHDVVLNLFLDFWQLDLQFEVKLDSKLIRFCQLNKLESAGRREISFGAFPPLAFGMFMGAFS